MNVKVLSRNKQIKKRNHNIDKNFYELSQSFCLKQLEFLNSYIKNIQLICIGERAVRINKQHLNIITFMLVIAEHFSFVVKA